VAVLMLCWWLQELPVDALLSSKAQA
jgi:hypothetical protein